MKWNRSALRAVMVAALGLCVVSPVVLWAQGAQAVMAARAVAAQEQPASKPVPAEENGPRLRPALKRAEPRMDTTTTSSLASTRKDTTITVSTLALVIGIAILVLLLI